jgi:alpha-beta hydrolase superfamily lysophospholipase
MPWLLPPIYDFKPESTNMALFQINREPSDRTLRQFAVISMGALPTLAWMTTHDLVAVSAAAIVGGLMALTWPRPQLLKRPFVLLSLLTAPIGMVLGEVLLLVMFFGVFMPIGLLFKLLRRDPLDRKFDRSARSYWMPKAGSPDAAAYLRQF